MYVKDKKTISLPFAIRAGTSFAAAAFHIEKRGKLEPGYYADLVIFKPDQIHETATYTEPQQYAQGMHYVFVNGTAAIEQGKYTGKLAGKALRRGAP
jgi:N-acyl-D-amino-acid deacylase